MQHARAITRKSASNLALAFILLPREKRDAMSALYAFCREIDDIADDEATPIKTRRQHLAAWREDIARACGAREAVSDRGSVTRSTPKGGDDALRLTEPRSGG